MNVPTMWIFRNVTRVAAFFTRADAPCPAHEKKADPFRDPPEMLRMLHFEKSARDIILTDSARLP
jgi:hypothetical protein